MLLRLVLLLAEQEGHEGPALLDPHSWGLVFWSAITFGVVLFVLRAKAWGPILSQLEKREKFIADSIAAAKKDREEASLILAEHKKQLEQVRNEAQAILNEAAADKKRLIEEAHAKAT